MRRKIIFVDRSEVDGTLRNSQKIECTMSSTTASHYRALYEVGEYILHNGPLIKTQDVGKVYLNAKGLQKGNTPANTTRYFPNISTFDKDTAYLLVHAVCLTCTHMRVSVSSALLVYFGSGWGLVSFVTYQHVSVMPSSCPPAR